MNAGDGADAHAVIRAEGICKRYGYAVALAPLSLSIMPGETVALVGPSGSGKTTLLRLLCGSLQPDEGSVFIDDQQLNQLRPGRELASLVGMIHQGNDLVGSLAVVHNVLAGRLGQWGLLRSLVSFVVPQEREAAFAALERVGIGEKLYERTSRLSGGEQQRVALARLLLQNPRVILADEPVSAVDPARAVDVINMLVGIALDERKTLVASLHSMPLALSHFQRVVALRDGHVWFDRPTSEVRSEHLDELFTLSTTHAST